MNKLERAIEFALDKHKGIKRKIDDSPYILHPLEVALIVSTMTNDEDVLAAAVLHDTVEDTDATIDEINSMFGERTAALVASETEDKRPGIPKSDSWRIRKQESLDELECTSDAGVKLIWLGDKLSNIRGIHRAYAAEGSKVFNSFNQKDPEQHAWYYRSIRRLLGELREYDAWKEFSVLIDSIFGKEPQDEV